MVCLFENEIMPYAGTLMGLESIVLSSARQTLNDLLSVVWGPDMYLYSYIYRLDVKSPPPPGSNFIHSKRERFHEGRGEKEGKDHGSKEEPSTCRLKPHRSVHLLLKSNF